jgi:predicted Zn-dependent protease
MGIDADRVAGWIEGLARRPEEIADVFVERRHSLILDWKDGEVIRARLNTDGGLAARCQDGARQQISFVSGTDDGSAREAIRVLQRECNREPLPARPRPAPLASAEEPPPQWERWNKRLSAMFERLAPRHRFQCTLTESARQVIPAHGAPVSFTRRFVSLEGSILAASRHGDETRTLSFHAPDGESTGDDLRAVLTRAGEPRDAPTPAGDGETDVVLADGCAAVLFHEILSHPLEAGCESPLSALEQARVAVPELEIRDDPTRLDLFGGYERDDEGELPRAVKLLDSGRLAGRLTDRAYAGRGGSNGHGRRAHAWDPPLPRGANLLVAGGQTTMDDMIRRLGSGLWITDLDRGSVELSSGRFRLHFPRARRIRRGRMADSCGPGLLAGDILNALKSVEAGLGREVKTYRALGWCARDGQVVPVGGSAPDVLLRSLAVRSLS